MSEDPPKRTAGEEIVRAIETAEVLAFPAGAKGAAKPARGQQPDAGGGGKRTPPRGRGKPSDSGEPPDGDGRFVIKRAANCLHLETTQAFAALAVEPALLFRFGDSIVVPCIIELKSTDGKITFSAELKEANEAIIRHALGSRTKWFRRDARQNDWMPINPPKEIACQILGDPAAFALPAISGVIVAPTLRPDGSVLDATGYDERTGLFYLAHEPMKIARISDEPSREDAEIALADLQHLISGFPFVDDTARSVGLSLLLTMAMRTTFDVVPLHGVSAPQYGSGKTYLVHLAAVISSGQFAGVIGANDDFREVEKAITGAMKEAIPIIFLDNLNHQLDSALVAQCVEQPFVRLRMLGSSQTFLCPNCSMIVATGVGLTVSNDLVRRSLLAQINAHVERAELREFDFRPIETVLDDRPRYVRACLVLGKFGMAAPPHGKPELASFERWDNGVRRPLIALGCADPCDSIETIRKSDSALLALARVQKCILNAFGYISFTSRDVLLATKEKDILDGSKTETDEAFAVRTALKEALLVVGASRGVITTRRIGDYLKRNIDRIVNGLSIKEDGYDAHQEMPLYKLERCEV